MKKKVLIALFAVMYLQMSMLRAQNTLPIGNFNVIPQPQEVVAQPHETPFIINKNTVIAYPKGKKDMQLNAEFLAGYIQEITGINTPLTTKARKGAIVLSTDSTLKGNETYRITAHSAQLTLAGATPEAVFRGTQTLMKALPIGKFTAVALPAAVVNDSPRFKFRGFLIDVGRHYFSVDYLKKMIDVMAMHNINYFHWHLTEDQGWRIEIKKYPNLTKIGSYRPCSISKSNAEQFDSIPVSGFYTQEEAREIVRYAAQRHITVIPEIDMPGHVVAALAAYPDLGCTGGPYKVETRFGVFADVLCAGKPQVTQFAKDVLNEIMDIFPSPYIHIGGDECPKSRWKACANCQAKIKELGLTDTPEHTKENQLQAWWMGEMEKLIANRGRKMLAWDEILEGNPTKSTTIMAWTSPKARIQSAQLGHQTISCPITNLYFSNPRWNQLVGVQSIERVYNFEPVPIELTKEQQVNIIGAEGCIWTEWTKTADKMEWQMMPRIAALAEIQWLQPEQKSLDAFLNRLPHLLSLYKHKGLNYKQDIYNVSVYTTQIAGCNDVAVVLKTFDNAPVVYAINSEIEPLQQPNYTAPFIVHKGTVINVAPYRNNALGTITEVKIE